MFSSSPKGRYCIVFNGEIFNFRSIRDELISEGVTFTTTSDTEVLLAAFCKYGEQVLDKLVGQFCICYMGRC